MPLRYDFTPTSPDIGLDPPHSVAESTGPIIEREVVVLLAGWFECGYDEVERAQRERMTRTGETVDEAAQAGLAVGGTWAGWVGTWQNRVKSVRSPQSTE